MSYPLKYLLLAKSREKVLSWSNLALTYCNHQVLTYSAAMWLSVWGVLLACKHDMITMSYRKNQE